MSKFGLKSKTVLIALGMLGVGIWAPGIPDYVRGIIVLNCMAHFGIRTITKGPIHWRKPK